MGVRTRLSEQVDALNLGVTSYEVQAQAVFNEAQRAAAYIPPADFEDVFNAAPEMEYHHRYVQSVLTWIWYEVNENDVSLDHLPDALKSFFIKFEEPFARYWM